MPLRTRSSPRFAPDAPGGEGAPAIAAVLPASSRGAMATAEDIPFRLYETGITPLRYPLHYAMFILVATLDIAFTWFILALGGSEVNPLARLVIDAWGLNGAIAFKYALTVFVIVLCEAIGRHRDRCGRSLAIAAIGISAVPVAWSCFLLASLAV